MHTDGVVKTAQLVYLGKINAPRSRDTGGSRFRDEHREFVNEHVHLPKIDKKQAKTSSIDRYAAYLGSAANNKLKRPTIAKSSKTKSKM